MRFQDKVAIVTGGAAGIDLAIAKRLASDIIVNNAGLMQFKALEQLTGDDWLRILSVDLLGAFYFTKQAFCT